MPEQVTVPVVDRHEVKVQGDERLIVDVRTPAEFGEVHIPGSINVPLPDLARVASDLKARAAGKEVVLVCRTGKRATAAFEQLVDGGFTDCRVLEGGISAWLEAELPVNRGRDVMSLERQVRIVAGALVVVGTALAAVVSPWFLLIPGFVGTGLVFAGVTDTCGMGMVLARLPWNRAPQAMACTTTPAATPDKKA